MRSQSTMLSNLGRLSALTVVIALTASLVACGDDNGDDNDENNDNGHVDASGMELETRGPASELIAQWNFDDGWTDAEGNEIDELPNPVDREGADGLEPLEAGGQRASLTLRVFDRNGDEINMDTLSRDDDTDERECTEYSARYYPVDDETDIIAWPNIQHPDSEMGGDAPFKFAETQDEEIVGIFHCDHVYIYPENDGTVDLEFMLWHINHHDDLSDPLTVVVEQPQEPLDI